MKIYTRTGDNGSTGLFGGPRVSKDDSRIEAYGTVDELNAAIGVARISGVGPLVDQQLTQVQHELFAIGAELATPDPERHGTRVIGHEHIRRLEQWIDAHEESLSPLRSFVLPAGSPGACSLALGPCDLSTSRASRDPALPSRVEPTSTKKWPSISIV